MNNTPQTFHQIWLGNKLITRSLRGYAQTWRDKHPDWSFELWDDARSYAPMVHGQLPQFYSMAELPKLLAVFSNEGFAQIK